MLLQLISCARWRLFWNALAAEAARAATVAAALLVLLLLLGTDILGWNWLVAVPAAILGIGVFFAARRQPGNYLTARILDARLRLADALSTAFFFEHSNAGPRFDEGMRRAQRERAAETARTVRASDAVPFRTPRMLYAFLPLTLIAGSLFLLRYAWQDQLDLRQPVPAVSRLLMRLSEMELAQFGNRKDEPKRDSVKEEDPNSADLADGSNQSPHGQATELAPPSPQDARQQQGNAATKSDSASQQQNQQPDARDSQGQPGDSESADRQQGAEGQQAQQSDSSSSLMAKVSDAVRNMLSRLGSQSKGESRKGEAARARSNSGQSGKTGQQQAGQQSGARQSQQQSSGAAQEASAAQGQQASQATGAGKDGESQDKQPGSSAGSEDGSKELKEARQLAAMGKISVILGKRANNITGNTSVESVSGKQTLVTPYSGARTVHTQYESRVDRDEVPVAFQDYVQRYFATVRSRPSKSAPPSGK